MNRQQIARELVKIAKKIATSFPPVKGDIEGSLEPEYDVRDGRLKRLLEPYRSSNPEDDELVMGIEFDRRYDEFRVIDAYIHGGFGKETKRFSNKDVDKLNDFKEVQNEVQRAMEMSM